MNYSTPFSRLLAEATDFELANSTFIKIGIRRDAGLLPATPEELAIEYVWGAGGLIDNGGLEYLFEGTNPFDLEFQATAEAHRTIGLTRCYEAFQSAFALFPDGRVPRTASERSRLYRQADEAIRTSINNVYWNEQDILFQSVANYIRANAEKLRDLDYVPPPE